MEYPSRLAGLTQQPGTELPIRSAISFSDDPLDAAIERTTDWMLSRQHPDGHWCGELEGDSILESEYFLLLTFLRRERTELAQGLAAEIRHRQESNGGWSLYPGGPVEISSSVKAYLALKIAGDRPDSAHMLRAKKAILAAGGVEKVNSFTRYYLALLGILEYRQCPAVPPELVLLPQWCPFNIYEMSSWSRTILVPLSLLWAHQPVRLLPERWSIREIFHRAPEELPTQMPLDTEEGEAVDQSDHFWRSFFSTVDATYKSLDRCHLIPFRSSAVKKAHEWMLERFQDSDGLGAIFPPMIWSVVGLKCLGYAEDSPEVLSQLGELERHSIREGERIRTQPCRSPVWDTAISTIALREAGVPTDSEPMWRATNWLLNQEVRNRGDWTLREKNVEPSGWCFEYNNAFYPDVDDTAMVLMALLNTFPMPEGQSWTTELFFADDTATDQQDFSIVSSSHVSTSEALSSVDEMTPSLEAVRRGIRWILAMQCRDGGWGAFDKDNTRELFTKVPFADHNAMIDPSTADLTARVLELFGMLGLPIDFPATQRALKFILDEQEHDGAWFGRWGVNYIYGTWQTIVGLKSVGYRIDSPEIERAANWLITHQQSNGGWGETPQTYDDPNLRGQGTTTASQTAWALMGLMAAGQQESDAVQRGIAYLLESQQPDGSWTEEEFTGTGFPKVFYLKYHYYRIYFPLMALGRYRTLCAGAV
ncbi:terpene cyclase/mutase family protein [Calycomorphotria hydatis]|uniref:Squalene--hopene cyclase n=1 Tax=Calycomorphotria hydatis TaxID=2528027 RepID=A0A517T9A6_9PLAN|nr:terpene cyclase/mutase family protein [Calycomorphotria hydatis]QDT64962.1 Squalene--hopene cyclase [Calycomorphotria hydatis]